MAEVRRRYRGREALTPTDGSKKDAVGCVHENAEGDTAG